MQRRRLLIGLVTLAAIFLPIALIFLPRPCFANPDWYNRVWQIMVTGRYFAHHFSFPAVLNTETRIGITYPMFYGHLFFPAFGVLSALFGPVGATRLGFAGLWALQFFLVAAVVHRAGRSRFLAFGVACLVSWTIYPLTNLYARGDLTELSATISFGCSVCALWLALWERGPRRRLGWVMLTGVLAAFFVGAHPITGYLGAQFYLFFLLPPIAVWVCRHKARELGGPLFAAALGAVVSVLPWVLIVLRMEKRLLLGAGLQELIWWPCYESPGTRFSLLASDLCTNVRDDVTAYLETQMNMPLLVFFVGLLLLRAFDKRGTRWARIPRMQYALALVGFAVTLIMSVEPFARSLGPVALHHHLARIQFPFRLITYINAFLLVCVVCELSFRRAVTAGSAVARYRAGLVVVCMALSLVGLASKLSHSRETVNVGNWLEKPDHYNAPNYSILPSTFYGLTDFTTPYGYQYTAKHGGKGEMNESLPLDRRGEVGTIHVHADVTSWMVTNVYAFPWNRVLVDGRPAENGDVGTDVGGFTTSVRLAPGDHKIGFAFAPPRAFEIARALSIALFLLWAAATVIYFAALRFRPAH